MMLNPMAAGLPEPQWTQYDPGTDFEDCEYRVDEMEILGVIQKYIMVRGTALRSGIIPIKMPAGVDPYYPMQDSGFAIACFEKNGKLVFGTSSITMNSASSNVIYFTSDAEGSLFHLFARVR